MTLRRLLQMSVWVMLVATLAVATSVNAQDDPAEEAQDEPVLSEDEQAAADAWAEALATLDEYRAARGDQERANELLAQLLDECLAFITEHGAVATEENVTQAARFATQIMPMLGQVPAEQAETWVEDADCPAAVRVIGFGMMLNVATSLNDAERMDELAELAASDEDLASMAALCSGMACVTREDRESANEILDGMLASDDADVRGQAGRMIGAIAARWPYVEVGEPAHDFTLDSIYEDGDAITLSDLRGKWVLLDFWASW